MQTIELLDKLKAKPVFRVQDVERIAYCNRQCARQILVRLADKGRIRRVRRNVYTAKDNVYVVAGNIVYPSYVSFWCASAFLGYTEQILNTVQVAVSRKAQPAEFEGYKIMFAPLREFYGYHKIATDDGDIFMAEDEKLLIDAFLRPDLCGNFDEIVKMFRGAKVSEKKMVSYLKKTGNNAVIKRVGFLLEKEKNMDLSAYFKPDRNYATLNPYSTSGAKPDAKWRVRV